MANVPGTSSNNEIVPVMTQVHGLSNSETTESEDHFEVVAYSKAKPLNPTSSATSDSRTITDNKYYEAEGVEVTSNPRHEEQRQPNGHNGSLGKRKKSFDWLPVGWTVRETPRKYSKTIDKTYYAPFPNKRGKPMQFRSKVEI